MVRPCVVGLIADTHGLLRPEALRLLEGSDAIVHAGDVGDPDILAALGRLAPVTVVRGNVDTADWAAGLPLTAELALGDARRLFVLHDVGTLGIDPAAAGFRAVVFGHSHRPGSWWKGGVLSSIRGVRGGGGFRCPSGWAGWWWGRGRSTWRSSRSCRGAEARRRRVRATGAAGGVFSRRLNEGRDSMLAAFLMGLVAGQRAMTPLAAVCVAQASGRLGRDSGCPPVLGHGLVAAGAIGLALAELAGDKVAWAPDRVVPVGLAARLTTAALAGAVLVPRRQRWAGAALGGATAVAASYPGWRLRMAAMRHRGQVETGLIEDAVVIAAACAIVASVAGRRAGI